MSSMSTRNKRTKVWVPKKLGKCTICGHNNGRVHQILTLDESFFHESYDVENYCLCYWCYESIMATVIEKTPIEYLISDEYHEECQDVCTIYDTSQRWSKRELERFPYYVDDHLIGRCKKYIKASYYHDLEVQKFLDYRANFIFTVTLRNRKLNEIAMVSLLAKEKESYIKCLPSEILTHVTSFL